ncbi:phage tail tape measure protein [Thermodesulfobacteriota bacterium]
MALQENLVKVREVTAANKKAAGAAGKMRETMEQGWDGAVTKFSSALDGLKNAIGGPLLNPLTTLIGYVTRLVQVISDFGKAHPILTKVGAIGAAVFGALLGAVATILVPLAGLV